VAAGINGLAELTSFIQAGRLRALAISSETRVAGVAIPTFVEQGVNVTMVNWRGVAGAPGIGTADRAALVALMDRMHASAEWKAALARNKWIDMYQSGRPFEEFLEREHARATTVLKSIGLVR
jgi:putative tricarboxylic transport membrane protein